MNKLDVSGMLAVVLAVGSAHGMPADPPTDGFADDWEVVTQVIDTPGWHLWGASPVLDDEGRVNLLVAWWPASVGWQPGLDGDEGTDVHLLRMPVERDAEGVLAVPGMIGGPPAPGKRVKVVPPEYAGTDVYCSLYLPERHVPGKLHPVIVEYTGNLYPAAGSTGRVKDAHLGYAVAKALGAIWVVMPYVSEDGRESVVTWWGSPERTTAFCLTNLRRICETHGGDPSAVFLCGFSRGAIGVNYLGLHDEGIADVWLGFFSHDHYDGVRQWGGTGWGSPLEKYRGEAVVRARRLSGRAALVSHNGGVEEARRYLDANGLLEAGQFTFLAPPIREIIPGIPNARVVHPHTDQWLCYPSETTEQVIDWFRDVLGRKPGTHTITGRVTDAAGHPMAGAVVESGATHFAKTDGEGRYVLSGLAGGKRSVRAFEMERIVRMDPDLAEVDFRVGGVRKDR
jgi:hypothetical protein